MKPIRLLLLSVLVGAGCGIVENADPAEEARVRLSGTSAVDLQLVTSTEFGFNVDQTTGERRVVMIQSDTAMIAPPFDEMFDISEHGIFLVRLSNGEQEAADVELEIFIDGSRKIRQPLVIGADEEGKPGSFEWSWLN
ncbi:MAG: hypothetical protein ACYC28_13445 [Longimicrobiales bacterium]